jgi:hypothetical protein
MGAKGERLFVVRRFEGETTDDAMAAEHPGQTPGPNDLVVVTIQFSGLTRAEADALKQQRDNRGTP